MSALFDKILGGVLFPGAAGAGVAAGPAAAVGLSATTLLGLVDPKNEAVRLLDVTPEHGEGTLDDLRTYAASRSPKNPPAHS